jgi:hypothetical protein
MPRERQMLWLAYEMIREEDDEREWYERWSKLFRRE